MQLKCLEAYGFKSFAERTVVQFDQGITAVVGPNGSGKSNITDAVRWVLGEQNIRMLRGLRSEDVIFAGSAARRALSVAEVILVFDNTDKTLPIDYDEVVVKRRIYRNGDSEVYLNDSRCRIKDIYQLFADTGIGHDGMSIIGQNRLNDILDSRPEERRVFFEETAGITKYRTRKQEALRKLRENDGDLTRLGDIMHAQAAELVPLSEQAQKTMKFRALDAERRQYQLTSLVQQYDQLIHEQTALDQKVRVYQEDEMRGIRARMEAEEKKNAIETDIAEIDRRIHVQEEESRNLQEKLDMLRQEAALIKGRQDQGHRREEDIAHIRQSASAKIEATAQESAQIEALLEQKRAEAQEKQREQVHVREKSECLQRLLSEEEQKKAEQEGSRIAVQRVLTRLREDLAVALNSARQGDESQQKQEEELEHRRALLAGAQADLAEKYRQIDLTNRNMQEVTQERDNLHIKIEEIQRAIERDEGLLKQADTELLRIRQSLDFQQRMQENYEGFGKDVQIVLQAKEEWRRDVAGTVADLISIPKRYLTAIDVALGGSARNIVTKDTDAAKAAISYLKRKNGGRVTFLPLTTITVRQPHEIDSKYCQGSVGWANTLVHTEKKFQKIVDHLLGRTLVMETLDEALILAKQEGYRLRIVTLTGELLNPGGALSGGGRRNQKHSLLNRRTEIDVLKKNLRERETAYEEMCASLEGQRLLLREADQRYTVCRSAVERIAQEIIEKRGKCDLLKERIADQMEMLHAFERAEEERLLYYAKLAKRRTQIERHISQCREHEKRFMRTIELLSENCTGLHTERRGQEERLHELEVSLAALSAEIETGMRHRKSRELEHAEACKALESAMEQEERLTDELQEDQRRLSVLESDIVHQNEAFQEHEKRSSVLKDQRLAHEAECRVMDAAIKAAIVRIEEVRTNLHECDKSLERIHIRTEDCRGSLLSDFGLTPEAAAMQVQDVEPSVLSERLHALENAIHELGPVNPNAVEEYEEKKTRYEEEEAQIQDLKSAKQDIEQIIRKIDQDMTRTFREAFHQIQEYFNEIFVRLFGGGIAELRLTDKDDILSSGIEILVTLPEKKRQNLSALSGGERALTVIALLFSFLRYRPSPFSILDEIDAPLDEANVSRFGDFLKEFAKNTQFIVVTHRKGTMRAADTMYGVTVEDAGVSKVLSIRMKDYETDQSA